jgi:uncharacterized Tic20 family protein
MNESNVGSVTTPLPTKDERTWGMIAHLSAFAGLVLPFAGIVIGPLVVWLIKRDESQFVADQGKEALNFNISVIIASVICGILVFVAIGILLSAALFIYWICVTIIAGIKASEGVRYRHRFTLRLVK